MRNTNFAITRDNKILVESNDIDYILQMKKELEYRRTGRTTRMLFQALGDPAEEVIIIGRNQQWSKMLFEMTCDILSRLNFEFTPNKTALTIENFGKTYYFGSNFYTKPRNPQNAVKYLDEK